MHLAYILFWLAAIVATVFLPDNLPDVLKQGRHFVLWRHLLPRGETKRRKVPFQVNGHLASHSDPATWSDFGTVLKEFRRRSGQYSGIMRAFAPGDRITGIDADNCFPAEQGDTAEITPWGRELVERLGSRTYHEESVSGHGLHIFGYATPQRCGQWPICCENQEVGKLEVYDRTRFFVVTGAAGPAVPRVLTDIQADVDALVRTLDRMKQMRDMRHPTYSPRPFGCWTPQAAMNYALGALRRYGVTGPIEHPRHLALLRLMGSLWGRGVPPEVVEWILHEVNQAFCRPPYSANHIAAMVRSAQKWDRA